MSEASLSSGSPTESESESDEASAMVDSELDQEDLKGDDVERRSR